MKRAEAPKRLKGLLSTISCLSIIFEMKKNFKGLMDAEITVANGMAQVFDPNPVVTLLTTDLTDDSRAADFTFIKLKS